VESDDEGDCISLIDRRSALEIEQVDGAIRILDNSFAPAIIPLRKDGLP
jgi:hypothetical protein